MPNGRLWMVLSQKHLLGKKIHHQIPQTEVNHLWYLKFSVLVDGKGVPIGVSIDGANRHDMKMSKATLQSIVIYRPEPTIKSNRSTCVLTRVTTFQKYTNC